MESAKLMHKYPNKIPLIIKTNILIDKKKFLVSDETTLGSFMFLLKTKYIHLKKHESLYIFFNNRMINSSITFLTLYERYKSDDGFLYANLVIENSFG